MKDKFLIGSLITVLSLLLLLVIFRLSFVTFIENYELGYKFDTRTGKTTIIERSGYVVEPPFLVRVHTIDLRPVQVCINANSRVLNCKLVRFNKKGFDLFISWHGQNDYSTEGSGAGSGNLKDILMSYAYDGSIDLEKNYPFLEVLKDLRPESEVVIANNANANNTKDTTNAKLTKKDTITQAH